MDDDDPPRGSSRVLAAELFVLHSEELLGFFRAMLPMAKVEAKDLLQQTFIGLLEWLDGDPSRTVDHPRGLLYTIARRRVLAYRGLQARTPSAPNATAPSAALLREGGAEQDDLEYLASLYEDRRGVLRAMRRLGPAEVDHPVSDLQLAVYLRFFAGMTEGQVGEILERPRGTIAGQLRRARVELSQRLAELEACEPGIARTSTTLLERWWHEVEARADEVAVLPRQPGPSA